MSTTQCQPGTVGFPLAISQTLNSVWKGKELSEVIAKLKSVTVPNEYTVNWPSPTNANISVVKPTPTNNVLQITGLDTYTNGTTMTYGDASYKCSNILSIVQNQHSFFSNEVAKFEAILSFQITNKNSNPSSPDIILFCRPLSYADSYTNPPMWTDIDTAASKGAPRNTAIDLSSIYGYNSSMLMPFITYQTCIPAKLIGSGSPTVGSLRIRVNVVIQPLRLNLTSRDLSTSVRKYTLPTNPVSLFPSNSLSQLTLQFKDGYGNNGFPSHKRTNLNFAFSTTTESDFDVILSKIQVQVPEAFLGKSLDDITSASTAPSKPSGKKAYKCYTIDPTKDIVDGQIMVDPTTGEKLADTQKEMQIGGEIDVSEPNVILPGDFESFLTTTLTVLGTLGLFGYLLFIVLEGRKVFHDQLPGTYSNLFYHVGIFILLVIALILFGIYLEKPAEDKHS